MYLCLSNALPHLSWQYGLQFPVKHCNFEFQLVGPDDEGQALFYDWLRQPSGQLSGLQIHLLEPYLWSKRLLKRVVPAEKLLFPGILRILFWEGVGVCESGLEAFGDIEIAIDNEEHWLIMVGTETWLERGEQLELRNLATKHPGTALKAVYLTGKQE